MVKGAHILLFIPLMLLANLAQAQEYRFYVVASKKNVSLGERIQLEYKVEGGKPQKFIPPQLKQFQFASNIMRGSETQIINNSVSRAYTFSFQVIAKETGRFTLPPARVTINNEQIKSDEVTIEVKDQSQQQKDLYSQIADNLFIKVFVSKKDVYVGEQVRVTYKMYKRVDLSHIAYKDQPTYEGFWKEVVSNPDQFELKPEVIDGVKYETGVLESVILFPQKSGELILDPYVLETKVIVQTRRQRNSNSFFDNFFGRGYKNVDYELKSPRQYLNVKPLPAGKPANFSGLVGRFDFKAELTKGQAEVNDAITLNVKVAGSGNLKLVKPWSLDIPSGIEDHDPKTHDKIDRTSRGIEGSRRFEYLMIPRREGLYKLPPIQFSYFDTKQEEYVNIIEDNLQFKVGKGDYKTTTSGSNQSNGPVVRNQSQIDVLSQDIQFISTGDVQLSAKGYSSFGSFSHLALSTAPFLGLVALLFVRRRNEEEQQDQIGLKKRKAVKLARKRLKEAKSFLDSGDKSKFYESLSKGLFGYLEDKYNIAPADMSQQRAVERLKTEEVGEETISQLKEILEMCEYARFAPGAAESNLEKIYEQAVELISKVEEGK